MYRVNLSDNSFIVADENYTLRVFRGCFSKRLTVKQCLERDISKYCLYDVIDGKKIKRTFWIEKFDTDIPVGSRIKMSQDIREGDLVKGIHGGEKVAELHTGVDDMYEIAVDGQKYVVNGGHILHLVDKKTNEPLDIPVNIYMYMNDEFRSHYAMAVVEEDK